MNTPDQTQHFPCGPCPLEDDLTHDIQFYTTMVQNLRLFSGTSMTQVVKHQLAIRINLVDGFLSRLHHLYDLSQDAIEIGGVSCME